MNSEESNDLLKKYLDAESTLSEEEQLFNSMDQSPAMERWSAYVNRHRKEAPANMNDSIMATIQEGKRKKRLWINVLGAAATVTILIISSVYAFKDTGMNYAEKEARLNEALAMFDQKDESAETKTVFYEDDIVIIYAESE